MKIARLLSVLLAVLLLSPLPARASATDRTNETLVLTTATLLPQRTARTAIEIQNLGPNPIYCALGSSSLAVVGKARRIDADGGIWPLHLSYHVPIYCITSVDQVTGAATITTELDQ